ncbi:MAG TPA: magnesium-translocating P-type ATPase [Actinomycetales bacterium]|nr:magnesium-translocating P-type ATPase [Actinomycetales bacterium]
MAIQTMTPSAVSVRQAAALGVEQTLVALSSRPGGLTGDEARQRLAAHGPNAVRSHHLHWLTLLGRQLRSPLLLLLAVTAAASFFLGQHVDALVILVILTVSVGLGFANEYRAQQAAEALHNQLRRTCVTWRDGTPRPLDVTELVPGDVVELQLGAIVPADVRLLDAVNLECDEAALTGESMPVGKDVTPVPADTDLAELTSCAFMGTVVQSGEGRAVVVATGPDAQFGRLAAALGEQQPETEFQVGLRRFSLLLVRVAAVLTAGIFLINLVLHRPVLDALLFSLAIAVGISPQLLPAVVSTSLAAGSRQLARSRVLVKRLVCIEDLGDMDVLFTDKTGTLTEGQLRFMRSLGPTGQTADEPLHLGLLCTEAVVGSGRAAGGNPLDVALWNSPAAAPARAAVAGASRLATLPFDHDRRMVSVLVDEGTGPVLITKGAPESVLERCEPLEERTRTALQREFIAGNRVVAVATRDAPGLTRIRPADERDLLLRGFLVFLDPPKASARAALDRLDRLGVRVKVLTGDNAAVATTVCGQLGLPAGGVLTGTDLDQLDDDTLRERIGGTTVFARVSPEHKARIVRAQRGAGYAVGFLGDGVNDAVALHAADVGVSVDTATDVAKDAADVILLEKDLAVVAEGVVGGRRIFRNTMKYVLMGTSSNFGNMFSAAGASAFLTFLPMLPSQILLNNMLYDSSQLAIPTDNVDPEQLERPARWDVSFIQRFMLVFGPISSVFDFLTFAVMLGFFHAGPALFRSGWFIESLATQTLVVFVIRTRRVPFTRSRPSLPLLLAVLTVVGIGAVLPATPIAADLGFTPLPMTFFLALVVMIVCYLALIEWTKHWFFRARPVVHEPRARGRAHAIHRRAAPFSRASLGPADARTPWRRARARPTGLEDGARVPAR